MPNFRIDIKPVKRSAGQKATAAAAYRAGERIRDERTGTLHNHSRRRDVSSEANQPSAGEQGLHGELSAEGSRAGSREQGLHGDRASEGSSARDLGRGQYAERGYDRERAADREPEQGRADGWDRVSDRAPARDGSDGPDREVGAAASYGIDDDFGM
jgi:hypothetical protein